MTDNIQKLYEIVGVPRIYSEFNNGKETVVENVFSPYRQLELIKWLSQNFDIVRFWVEHSEYIAEIDGVFDVDKEFNQALAGLILELWKDLTVDQKQEIKGILQ